jgi:hypothetical protein
MRVVEDQLQVAPGEGVGMNPLSTDDLPCDKIVVFSAFPSSNVQLLQVSANTRSDLPKGI